MALVYPAILMFCLYVVIGMWPRGRPDIHPPLKILGSPSVMPAPLDRIDAVRELYSSTVFYTICGPIFSTLAIGTMLVLVKSSLTRSLDRWFCGGLLGLFFVYGIAIQVATTDSWNQFASLLVH